MPSPPPKEAAIPPPPAITVLGTSPYPWPYDGRLDAVRLALLVAGWDHRWAGATAEYDHTRDRVAELVHAVERAGGLVVAIAHETPTLRGLASSGVPLVVPAAARSVTAAGIDGFFGSHLDVLLRRGRRTQLLMAGLGLEGPVHSTLRSANDRGYECLTVVDACAPLDREVATAGVSTIEMSGGIFGAVGSTAAVLHALDRISPPTATEVSV